MAEAERLIATLKTQLRAQRKTYRDVALGLGISEPSVKRLFASRRITLARLEELATLLGFTLAELAQLAEAGVARLHTLTEVQERELVSDTRLLLVAVCTLNHWTMSDMVAVYRLTEVECLGYLLLLDRLRLIDLLPGNRIRINIARDFDWLPEGPIRNYFRDQGLPDFLDGSFAEGSEEMAFVHGMLTEAAITELQIELRRLRKKFAGLHEEVASVPMKQRRGIGLLLAVREWEPAGFAALRRGA
ncbi:MAG: helix-turn-helix domain-containing protein [Zoogloeaceae bacterium]|nr:helix-turn-helix domain-containing protein [Zoogloeaceae bacterium]